jgi:hypothetical protein
MSTITRAGRFLRSLSKDDAVAVLDMLDHAVRCWCTEPVAPTLRTMTEPRSHNDVLRTNAHTGHREQRTLRSLM